MLEEAGREYAALVEHDWMKHMANSKVHYTLESNHDIDYNKFILKLYISYLCTLQQTFPLWILWSKNSQIHMCLSFWCFLEK